MASSSLTFRSLQLQIPSHTKSSLPFSKSSTRRFNARPIKASVSSETTASPTPAPEQTTLPIRKIPGDYGLPFIGPIKDRQDYFYNQGRNEFFKSRVEKYKSTVFRANMPPGPFIAGNPNVIVLLDGKSFPVLFDNSKVEKKDLFTGTYMPSLELTGGYRICSYLDPSEPSHAKLKEVIFFLLKSSRERLLPEFHLCFTEMFESLESTIAKDGKASLTNPNDQASFNFVCKSLLGVNPADTKLGTDGPSLIQKWVVFNLGPILTLGLPRIVEEPLLHTVPLPPFLVKGDYQRLYDFFYASSTPVLDEAVRLGISREEACHNILFATCFNTFGGMKIIFPNLLKWIGLAETTLHAKLAEEVRSAVKSNGGKVTMGVIEQMPLLKSVVYENLRIEPPVPLQYGKAKRDLVIESHDNAFEVKSGEMLFGFQPFATKDPKIFDKPGEFVPDRFVGEGEKLLKHLLWSNGPETESPTIANKQCAGKDFVVLVSRLLLVEFFMRYDSFTIDVGTSPLGAAVTVKTFTKASASS